MPTDLPSRRGQFRLVKPGPVDRQREPYPQSKLSDRGLVDFRRVCKQVGILDEATDTIRPIPQVPSE